MRLLLSRLRGSRLAAVIDAGWWSRRSIRTSTPRHIPRRRRWLRRSLVGLGCCAFAGVAVLVGTNRVVTDAADGLTYDDVDLVPECSVAVVFGTGVVDGRPTPKLADRIDGAVKLYQAGKVTHVLMTGDHSRADYDEVTVMRDVAVRAGVPASVITRDHAGLDTYDSCYRAREIFGVHDAVLVTQDYHLSRALYLCRAQGVDAVGLDIPDWQHHPDKSATVYPLGLQIKYTTREWVARTKAVIEVTITRPAPRVLGPYQGLGET